MNLTKFDLIEKLEKEIKIHNKKYFIENNPIISDEEFDELTKKLKKLKPNSTVLYEIVGETGTIKHQIPMLSLEKKYSYDEVKKWIEDIGDSKFLIEPKYDGMAAKYQNGILSTRGDGYLGENITERLKHLKIIGNLDHSSDEPIFGEITIPTSYFNKNLSKTYKNPRNAAVGIVKAKRITPEGIKALIDKAVHFVIYDQAKSTYINKSELVNEISWQNILEEIYREDYQLDGVVIKATNNSIRENIGRTQHHEKWQIAYKSPAERKWSTVKEIKDQVGRTGRVTSVAIVNPIELSGATISNITLHNADFVKKSRIGIGSQVEICRSGEVIPFITKVIPANKPHILRTTCPICDSKLTQKEKFIECPNSKCPARLAQSIEYFFKTLNVQDLGLKTIEKFINEFKLNSISDFYHLNINQISKLDGFGEKSSKKITQSISNTLNKSISQSQLLQALGLEEIGPATSKWIISYFGFENLSQLDPKNLKEIKGIGEIKAKKFVNSIKEKWHIIEHLSKLGLQFNNETRTNTLKSKSFAITGKKSKFTRDEIINLINDNGGIYKNTITKDTDYLIAGEAGGSKLSKAKKWNIKIIDENDLLNMIKL